eukprot:CAMPEP_0117682222 /NCGR_PEP_ID=MMETSP0804-20121206/19508_1 /TAXON_ID=1074897 /ORGANISM="Tetraselmis astigmatica, Strain CCMP880" /LENGTH=39 /DNA_ID= /DNA_START= /DNA_END= /DNA_ORIENTATION=
MSLRITPGQSLLAERERERLVGPGMQVATGTAAGPPPCT